MKGSPAADVHISVVKAAHVKSPFTVLMMLRISFLISRVELSYTLPKLSTFTFQFVHWEKIYGGQMILIRGGKSALWWEQKRQMRGGKSDKLGGGKSDKGKWYTIDFTWWCPVMKCTSMFPYSIYPDIDFQYWWMTYQCDNCSAECRNLNFDQTKWFFMSLWLGATTSLWWGQV